MAEERLILIDESYLEKVIDANIKNGSLQVNIHNCLGSGYSERNYWLQISFFAHPNNMLLSSSVSELTMLHWEVVKLIAADQEIYYRMNFLMPLGVLDSNETNVLFPAKFIHQIVKNFADSNPVIVPRLNDCIGLENIKILPIGKNKYGITLIFTD